MSFGKLSGKSVQSKYFAIISNMNLFPKKDFNFYQGKMFTLRYFFAYELPKTLGLAKRLMGDDRLTVEMDPEYFSD